MKLSGVMLVQVQGTFQQKADSYLVGGAAAERELCFIPLAHAVSGTWKTRFLLHVS